MFIFVKRTAAVFANCQNQRPDKARQVMPQQKAAHIVTAKRFSKDMNMIVYALVLLPLIGVVVEGLECYSCQNVTFMANCNAVTKCLPGSICYADVSTLTGERRYTLGCRSDTACPSQPTASPASSHIVGRSLHNDTCSQCCETGMCNRQLCQNADPGCTDTTDCTVIGSYSNLCDDVDHIKNVCKKFCGLCSLVDGGWSNWGTWSTCDVTCENGTRTRTRMCNDPKPFNGGKACVGRNQDSGDCTVTTKCPVAGGWGQWSPWGSCSVTCDIGMQRRDRSCNSPSPTNAGNHCYGESRDDRLCQPGPCTDGHWSSWSSWGSCTVTCGGGLRTRTRTCDNPVPSLTGKYCIGNQMQADTCGKNSCQATIAFNARHLTQGSFSPGQHLVYRTAILNVGGGYNPNDGYFTAPVHGTYLFNVHICTPEDRWLEVYIMAKGNPIVSANHAENSHSGSCAAGSGVAILDKGDKAWIQCNYPSAAHGNDNEWNSFSGVLIGP